ncbi:TonB-dependent siderophore receptor [Pseudoxanthomonas indica]|uniref:Outer-membrane receptor for ferric coprogen and ferric-rhodotorulic acid n=1 Tax=Pseudoxanthomonas indica TaxID=428993 RepID=A0A1T5KT60_9GAMM|nr:TonB-dependent siderophore receptor [Pseudoxanthomonas indica]GGD51363.1 ligand-gated channel protein [Pseudoxanthomonas indica]SKC66820.1 outer-membrane receptor for ferric coprogen and ferric-rhodotorulic acid [Pseudoxanthomonas indica]
MSPQNLHAAPLRKTSLLPVVRGRLPLSICLALACVSGPLMAQEASGGPSATADTATELDSVLVVAQRAERVSNGATNLDLDIKDTPQSISVVSNEQMQQFGTDSLNEALRLSTGIQVDEWETNRTTFTSRGFDIENTQIDGVGLPNDWGVVTGAMDTFGYEKLEVIRGANGLLTGVGNAAGTINYVRKRPTNDAQGLVGISYGSWATTRAEVDYSTPFIADGTWAGRVVAAHEQGDSYLRGKDDKRDFLYGVVDGQLGDNGTLTVGYSWQKGQTNGNMWGALGFMYSDGTQAEWDRSASTTQDWTNWDTTTQNAFAEYTHRLGEDWQLKLSYNYRDVENATKLFYAIDYNATGLEPGSNLGLFGYPWRGDDEMSAHLGTATINGHFQWLGRDQEVMFGVSWAKSEANNWEYAEAIYAGGNEYGYIQMPGFPWAGNVVPEPEWGALSLYGSLNQRLKRAFGATHLSFTDRFKGVLGFNYAEYHRDGASYGAAFDQTESHTSPYAGLTYDFNEQILGYVSYSDIYHPQSQTDVDGMYLDPTKGSNYEVGVKADWLDKRLLTTLAVFKAEQDGLATGEGYNQHGQYYYVPVDVESKGVEFEATGKISDNVDLVVGATALKLTGRDGDDTFRWVPRRTANLLLSARLPSYAALSYGLGARWQSDISNQENNGFVVRQDSYAVFNGFVAWDFVPNATLRLNVNNIGDEKYINTLRYSGYYGAPRNYTLSLNWRF